MNPYLLCAILFVGILFDWYTTKVGLALGLKEGYPLFKGKNHKQILAIKLLGFAILSSGVWDMSHGAPMPIGWTLFVGGLTALQYVAAYLNWQKVKKFK